MKADDQTKTPTVATNPVTGATMVPPPSHRPANADAAVGEGIAQFYRDVKSWAGRNTTLIGIVLAVILVVGIYMFWSGQSKQGSSRLWASLVGTDDPAALKAFADQNADTVAGRVARMELARVKLGTDGIGKLNSRDADERKQGIENIEKARAEFLAIAQEFPNDVVMKTEAMKAAATAELALVGIPKADDPESSRGSVDEAVKIYDQIVATVGEGTSVGTWAKERAATLTAEKSEIEKVGKTLDKRMRPAPPSVIKPPVDGIQSKDPQTGTGVKPVAEPIKSPAPPTTSPKPPATKPSTVPSTR